jgi:hypothetical protein
MIGAFLRKIAPTHAAKRMHVSHDRMMHLVEGRRGRGKSYLINWWVWNACKKKIPCNLNFSIDKHRLALMLCARGIWSNFVECYNWLDQNIKTCKSWDEWMCATDSICILDESVRMLHEKAKFPPIVMEWFTQSRKLKNTVVLVSQSFDWLNMKVRQLSDYSWLSRKQADKRGNAVKFWYYGMDPYANGMKQVVAARQEFDFMMTVDFILPIAKIYNTFELINVFEPESKYQRVSDFIPALPKSKQAVDTMDCADFVPKFDYVAPMRVDDYVFEIIIDDLAAD